MDQNESELRSSLLPAITRRKLLVGGVTLTISSFAIASRGFAQDDATPEASEGGPTAAGTPEATEEPLGPTVPPEFGQAETDWLVEGGNLNQTRDAAGTTISTETVGTLGEAWRFPVSVDAPFGSLVANPIVFGDTVYLQDAKSNIYAIDKATGTQKWSKLYDQDVPSGGPNGIAIGYGRAVFPVGSGLVAALDLATGTELWNISIEGPLGEGITMAPAIYDNTVYISTVPGAPDGFYQGGMRGFIFALDVRDGSVIWYFDTTTDNLWGNARVNSGGGLWHPPSIDADGNLYVGIANAAPWPGTEEYPAASSRPGDNDYANALMRLDPKTASVTWYINVKPGDPFDHDNQLSPILADVDGTPMVFSSGKHGWVVAANSETGAELWRTAVGEHNDAEFATGDQIPAPGATPLAVLPGALGGVETPIAYADGQVFAPAVNLAFAFTGSTYEIVGGNLFDGTGTLVALDATTGAINWSVNLPTLILGGATVANDIVFTAGLDGLLRGFNVADGTQVYTFQASAGINASPAISGDYLFLPAGGFLSPSSDTVSPAPELKTELIALKLGSGSATPAAS